MTPELFTLAAVAMLVGAAGLVLAVVAGREALRLLDPPDDDLDQLDRTRRQRDAYQRIAQGYHDRPHADR